MPLEERNASPRIREVLGIALQKKQDRLRVAMAELAALGSDAIVENHETKKVSLLSEVNTLSTEVPKLSLFLQGPPPPRSDQEVGAILKAMPSSSHFAKLNREFATALKKGLPGTKRTKRDLFLDVFDLMMQSRRMTLGKAIGKLCGYSQVVALRESVRVGIRDNLKPILKEFAPDLLERFESLHPDRRSMRRKSPQQIIPSA